MSERKLKGPLAVLAALDKHIKAERALGYEASANEGEEARSIVIELYWSLANLLINVDDHRGMGYAEFDSEENARAALQRAEGEV